MAKMANFGGNALNLTVAEELFSSDSSESDSEIIYEMFSVVASSITKKMKPRNLDNMPDLLRRYGGEDFKEIFRLTRATFEFVLSEVACLIKGASYRGQVPVSPDKQLLLSLYVFATPDSYSSVSERFEIGKSTAIGCVQKVTAALCKIASTFIRWPSVVEALEIRRGFEKMSGFPRVVGAIDATHIKIRTPRVNNPLYANKKGGHSVILQGVCNHKAEFTHCYAGQAGSVHDSWVLQQSEVFSFKEEDGELRFPKNSHLLGDSAYPCTSWLMVPFKDDAGLTQEQKNFNFCLASGRYPIEHAFGLLKGRWRRLRYLDMHNTHFVPQFIVACCVLHNICLSRQDVLEEVYSVDSTCGDDDDDGEDAIIVLDTVGTQKRIDIMNSLKLRFV